MTEGRALRDRRLIAAGVAPAAVAVFAAVGSFVDSRPVAGPTVQPAVASRAAPVEVDSLRASIVAVRAEITSLKREIKARNKRVEGARAAAEARARAETAPKSAPAPVTHSTTGASGGG